MTGFENRLTEVLTEEARRHEAPVFDAYAIAGRAGVPAPRRRHAFGLAAGIVALAAVSAGAVYGISGGSDAPSAASVAPAGLQRPDWFERSSTDHSGLTAAQIFAVLQARVRAAGIGDLSFSPDGHRLAVRLSSGVSGASVLPLLQTAVAPGVAGIRPVLDPTKFGLTPPAQDCATPVSADMQAKLATGMDFVCSVATKHWILVGPVKVTGTELVTAQARESETSQGVLTGNWEVHLKLSPDGARDFATLTTDAARDGTQIAVVVDQTSYSEASVMMPITDGEALITGNLTKQAAQLLAAVIGHGPLPAGFKLTDDILVEPR